MKTKLFVLFLILAIALGGMNTRPAMAQAYTTAFTTSVTYQNVGTATTATLRLWFYATPSTVSPTFYDLTALPAGAGSSLFIGGLDDAIVADGFQGSAILESDQPILVTLVQLPQGSLTVKTRALSNGFAVGAAQALIPTVLKNTFDTNTKFSVQNVDSVLNTVTIDFYDTSANLVHTITADIEPGAAFFVDAGTTAGLGTAFNGSAIVAAERSGGAPGLIVATAMELEVVGTGDKAFEGVASGGTLFYMPSALCDAFGGYRSAYAVQNTSLTDTASVQVTYTDGTNTYVDGPFDVGPGAKRSFVACTAAPVNFNGSGVVQSMNGVDITAIGKVFNLGATTAFNGVEQGESDIALPYVRWANDADWNAGTRQRVFITIQNVGTAIPAGTPITVEYVDRDGNTVGTHTFSLGLAAQAKFNSNASLAGLLEFGFYAGGATGGSVIITGPAGSQLAAVARVSTKYVGSSWTYSEDYNGLSIP